VSANDLQLQLLTDVEVIQGHTIRQIAYGFLLVFHLQPCVCLAPFLIYLDLLID